MYKEEYIYVYAVNFIKDALADFYQSFFSWHILKDCITFRRLTT